MSRSISKRVGWAAILVISAVLLTIGASRDRGAATTPERVRAIAATTKCPVCVGESVGQSNAPASLVIKEEIARLVSAGRSDDQVRADIARSYPDAIQLTPPATGAGSIVWILPVVLLIAVSARLFVVFRREQV
jgi:cytochrome c-type biogenesis protein CcmH/NrfF